MRWTMAPLLVAWTLTAACSGESDDTAELRSQIAALQSVVAQGSVSPTATATATNTTVPTATPAPTGTLEPPTATPAPPTASPVPLQPTATPVPALTVAPTPTPAPPTSTPIPPTPTALPTAPPIDWLYIINQCIGIWGEWDVAEAFVASNPGNRYYVDQMNAAALQGGGCRGVGSRAAAMAGASLQCGPIRGHAALLPSFIGAANAVGRTHNAIDAEMPELDAFLRGAC